MRQIVWSLGLLWLINACSGDPQSADQQKAEAKKPAEAAHQEAPTELVELTSDQLRIGDVQIGTIDYRNLGQELLVNGRLVAPAQSQVAITGLQGGFIRKLPLLPGQPVRKGQLLARIENPDLVGVQQEYAENQSRLTYLDAEYIRQKELSEQNVSALKVFQQITAERAQVRARLNGLTERLRLVGLSPQAALNGTFTASYAVTAPITGVVTDISATIGQYVQPTDVIARIISTQGIYAELTVFEKDLPQLRVGQSVSLRLTSEASREHTAKISYINPTIDADRSVRVIAQLEQMDSRLVPNTFLKAMLDLGDSRVPALPEEAIVSTEGKDYIFVVTTEKIPDHHGQHPDETEQPGTTFRRIPVRRGVSEGGYSQVTLPNQINLRQARVVVKGAYAVLSQLTAASGEEEGHAH